MNLLHLALIRTSDTILTFHSFDTEDLDRQVAAHCRENWKEHMDGDAIPESDAEIIEAYFDNDGHGEWMDREEIDLASTAAEPEPAMPTFTFWCQQSDGTGTIYIGSLEAPDIEAAKLAAVQECCDEWNSGSGEDDEPTYTPQNIHLLGIAAGDVEILHWQDICEA
jgi:hypothetical protein